MPAAATAKKSAAPRPRPVRRRTYHHGNLAEALIEATLRLIEEGGPESVSVREAAKRAGVSSAAPFRHFPTRTALMTAVAEQAMRRLRDESLEAMEKVPSEDPIGRFRALGSAYLRWAVRNPTHFQVVANRSVIDFEGSPTLGRDNDAIRDWMDGLVNEAQRRGLLRSRDLVHIPIAAKAVAYGLARMYVDGHFVQWGAGQEKVERTMQTVLDVFLDGLLAETRSRRKAGRPRRSRAAFRPA